MRAITYFKPSTIIRSGSSWMKGDGLLHPEQLNNQNTSSALQNDPKQKPEVKIPQELLNQSTKNNHVDTTQSKNLSIENCWLPIG
jgi:hypothetical protein